MPTYGEGARARTDAIEAYLRCGSYRAAGKEIGRDHTFVFRAVHDPQMLPTVDRLRRDQVLRVHLQGYALLERAQERALECLEAKEDTKTRNAFITYGIAVDKVVQLGKFVADLPQSDHMDYFDPDAVETLRIEIYELLSEQSRRLLLAKQQRQTIDGSPAEAQPGEAEPARPMAQAAARSEHPDPDSPYAGLPPAEEVPDEPAAQVAASEPATVAPTPSDSPEEELERMLAKAPPSHAQEAREVRVTASWEGAAVALKSPAAQSLRVAIAKLARP